MTFRSLALIGAAMAVAGVAQADTCQQISGTYGPLSTAALILGPDGKTLYGQMMNGGRPNFYGTCTNGAIKVSFPDDPGFSGEGSFDGKTIKWSNNTTWDKNSSTITPCDLAAYRSKATEIDRMHMKYNTLTSNSQAAEKQALKAQIAGEEAKLTEIGKTCR